MLRRQATRLFPLHLAPIDAFFLADDTLTYPMTSIIHLDFSGRMNRSALEEGLSDALERHPLLGALIRPAKRGELCWVLDPETRPPIDWAEQSVAIDIGDSEQIDLTTACGLRIWVRLGEASTRMTLQVHHACTDGTGVYRFLGDMLASYGIQTCAGATPPALESLDPNILRERRRRMANIAVSGRNYRWIVKGLGEGWRLFGRNVQDLAAVGQASIEPKLRQVLTPFPGIETAELSKDEHLALRDVATAHGAMLNDLLMSEMFRAIARWNSDHGIKETQRWLRIMMPFDLREQSEYMMPAANMTSYTFVDRREKQCRDPVALLKDVRDETLRIKQDRGGTRFIDALMLANTCPGLVPWMLRRGRCISSVTLSNIGDPTKRFMATFPRRAGRIVCGNLELENVTGVPPMRDRMRATCAIFSYLRKLTFSFRCDPYTFTAADTRAFLQTYVDGLRSFL